MQWISCNYLRSYILNSISEEQLCRIQLTDRSDQLPSHDFQGNQKATSCKDQTYKKTVTVQLPHLLIKKLSPVLERQEQPDGKIIYYEQLTESPNKIFWMDWIILKKYKSEFLVLMKGKEIQRKYTWSRRINFVKWTPDTELQVNLWKSTILDAAAKAKIKVHTTSSPRSGEKPCWRLRRGTKPNLTHKTCLEYTVFQALNTSAVEGADSGLRGIFSLRLLQSHVQYLRSSPCAFVTAQRLDCEKYIATPARNLAFSHP